MTHWRSISRAVIFVVALALTACGENVALNSGGAATGGSGSEQGGVDEGAGGATEETGSGDGLVDSTPLGQTTGAVQGGVEISGTTVTDGAFRPAGLPVGISDPSFIITAHITVSSDAAAVSGSVTLAGQGLGNTIVTAVMTRAAATIAILTTITSSTGTYAIVFQAPQDGDVVFVAAEHGGFTATARAAIDILGKVDERGNPIFGVGGTNNLSSSSLSGPNAIAFGKITASTTASFSGSVKRLTTDTNVVCAADSMNHRVLCWVSSGSRYARVVIGQPNFVSSTPQVSAAGLWSPQGVAISDKYQLLFVSTSDGRILVYELSKLASGMNATFVLGQASSAGFTYAPGCTGSITVGLGKSLGGMALDPKINNLFVADTKNNRVVAYQIFSLSTMLNFRCSPIARYLGQASGDVTSPSSGYEGLNQPTDVAVDAINGRLYVADSGNHRVVAYALSSNSNPSVSTGQRAIRVYGRKSMTVSGTPWSDGLSECQIANGNRIAVSADGKYLYVSGTRQLDGGKGSFGFVKRFPAGTSTSTAPAADLAIGYQNGSCALTTAATQSTSSINASHGNRGGLAVDPATGTLFASDFGHNRILQFKPGETTATDGLGQLTTGGTFDSTVVGANNISNSSFDNPASMVIAEDLKKLFITDTGNSRILVFNLKAASDGTLVLEDRMADYILGQQDGIAPDPTDAASGAAAQLSFPTALAYKNGYLYVADTVFKRISVFDVNSITSGEPAVYVIGDASFRGNNTFLFGDKTTPDHMTLDPSGRHLFFISGSLLCVDLNEGGKSLASRIADYQASGSMTSYTAQATNITYVGNRNLFTFSRKPSSTRFFISGGLSNKKMTFKSYDFYGASCSDFSAVQQTLTTALDHIPDRVVTSNDESYLFVSSSSWNGVAMIPLDAAAITAGSTLPVANLLGADALTEHDLGVGIGQLNSPLGMELCPNDKCLFVSDNGNNRGMIFNNPFCAGPNPVRSNCN